jgi:hypothetical protein
LDGIVEISATQSKYDASIFGTLRRKIKPIQNCDEATAAMQHLTARSVFVASWDQQSGVCDEVLRGGGASRRSRIADAGAKVLAGEVALDQRYLIFPHELSSNWARVEGATTPDVFGKSLRSAGRPYASFRMSGRAEAGRCAEFGCPNDGRQSAPAGHALARMAGQRRRSGNVITEIAYWR